MVSVHHCQSNLPRTRGFVAGSVFVHGPGPMAPARDAFGTNTAQDWNHHRQEVGVEGHESSIHLWTVIDDESERGRESESES